MKHLSAEEVRALHTVAIELDGGVSGERDPGGLESAVAQPGADYFGQPLHPTLALQAAAYLFHVCQAHAFLDGNKRTALAATLVFLRLNGVRLALGDAALFELTLAVARGDLDRPTIAARLEPYLQAL